MIQYFFIAMTLFLPPTNPQLYETSTDVCPCDIASDETQEIIDTMFKIVLEKRGVGIAAPQIGIPKRMIIVDLAATGIYLTTDSLPPDPQFREFINPEILWKSEQMQSWREGCFSTGQICGIVPRAQTILIRAYDRSGNILTHECSGYTARIFQHEIDHLDGILFPDRIENDAHLHYVEESEKSEYRVHWPEWKKLFSRDKWNEIKTGSN